jgi:hypothetical protein
MPVRAGISCECGMDQVKIVDHIFFLFPTYLLGILSFLVAIIHVHKYFCAEGLWPSPESKRPAYLVRSLNWTVFGIALILFPHFNLMLGRATLRIALAFMVLSELSYNYAYLGDIIKAAPRAPSLFIDKLREFPQWTRKLLRL